MGLFDPHDPKRRFTHFVKLNADGSVAAIVERADHAAPPADGASSCYVDVTAFRQAKTVVDLYRLKFDAAAVRAAMETPAKDRSSLLSELNRAFGAALPDALADAVFGKADGHQ